jgi:ABC-2 type transport system permease protein
MTSATTALLQFSLRSMRHSLRDAEALLMAIILPTVIMLLFTTIFGGAIDTGGGAYVDYIVPGVIFLCAGFGSATVAVYVATDMQNGIIDRFRVMPIPAYGVVVGHVSASVLRNAFATALVIGVGVMLGFRPTANLGQWLAAIGIILAFIIALTWLFAAIGLASGSPTAANGYGFVLLFLPYLSSAFVPTETMPGWIQPVAEHQPMTPIIESVRSLLSGHPAGDGVWITLAWIAGILLVAVSWSVWAFRRRAGRR